MNNTMVTKAIGIISRDKLADEVSDIFLMEYTGNVFLLSNEMMVHPKCCEGNPVNLTEYILNVSKDKNLIRINIVYSDELKNVMNPFYVRPAWLEGLNSDSISIDKSDITNDELRQRINSFIKTDGTLNKVWLEIYYD